MLHSAGHGVDFNFEIEATVNSLLSKTVTEVMATHIESFVDLCIKKMR